MENGSKPRPIVRKPARNALPMLKRGASVCAGKLTAMIRPNGNPGLSMCGARAALAIAS